MAVTPKVATQSAVGIVSGFVAWLILLEFHTVPADVKAAIPGVVAVVLGFLAGFIKKEQPVITEVEAVLAKVEADVQSVLNVVNGLAHSTPPVPPPTVQYPLDPPVV